jgi:hypothetical protein
MQKMHTVNRDLSNEYVSNPKDNGSSKGMDDLKQHSHSSLKKDIPLFVPKQERNSTPPLL